MVDESSPKVSSFSSSVQSDLSNPISAERIASVCHDHVFKPEASPMPDRLLEQKMCEKSTNSNHEPQKQCSKSAHNMRQISHSLKKRPPKLGDTLSPRNARSPPSASSRYESTHSHISVSIKHICLHSCCFSTPF